MDRRSAVKKLVIASGGWISLPFWMTACHISDKATHFSSFSPEEQEKLAALTDIILPAGPSIGALSVGVDKYLQKLIDDCYDEAARGKMKKQLAGISAVNRSVVVNGLVSQDKDVRDFFVLVKNETIKGFNTSQQVMEGYLGYKVAPGHYYGNVSVKP